MKTVVLTLPLEAELNAYAKGTTFALNPQDRNEHHDGGFAPPLLRAAFAASGAGPREAVVIKGLGRNFGAVLTTHFDKTPLLFVKELNDELVATMEEKVTQSTASVRLEPIPPHSNPSPYPLPTHSLHRLSNPSPFSTPFWCASMRTSRRRASRRSRSCRPPSTRAARTP